MIDQEKYTLTVVLKRIYGNLRFYPQDQLGKMICKLMRVRSFSQKQLGSCKEAGWNISIEEEKFDLDEELA